MRGFVLIAMIGCASSTEKPAPAAPAAAAQPAPEPAPNATLGSRGSDAIVASGDPCEGGEVYGAGGLGLRGAGAGGGGTGEGVGLGAVGRTRSEEPGRTGNRSIATVAVKDGQATVSGSLDPTVIRRIVRQHLGQLRYCYERELRADPTLAGKVVARFTIGPQGAVTAATATGLNAAVEGCIASVLRQVEFPAPAGGGAVEVSYPLVFASE